MVRLNDDPLLAQDEEALATHLANVHGISDVDLGSLTKAELEAKHDAIAHPPTTEALAPDATELVY